MLNLKFFLLLWTATMEKTAFAKTPMNLEKVQIDTDKCSFIGSFLFCGPRRLRAGSEGAGKPTSSPSWDGSSRFRFRVRRDGFFLRDGCRKAARKWGGKLAPVPGRNRIPAMCGFARVWSLIFERVIEMGRMAGTGFLAKQLELDIFDL
jgi:hypothetical protein